MDGASRPAASPVPIEFGGKTYLLSQLTIRDLGTIEQHLKAKKRAERMQLAADVYQNFPQDVAEQIRKEAWQEAMAIQNVPMDEAQVWLESKEGVAFVLWLMLRKEHPGEFSLDQMWDFAEEVTGDVLGNILRKQAMGVGEGNSTSPNQDGKGTKSAKQFSNKRKTAASR